jgi:hypothetical protein
LSKALQIALIRGSQRGRHLSDTDIMAMHYWHGNAKTTRSRAAVRELIENGLPEAVARTRVEVHRGFSTGAFAEVTGNVQTLLHRAPRSFAEFARDYTSAFR